MKIIINIFLLVIIVFTTSSCISITNDSLSVFNKTDRDITLLYSNDLMPTKNENNVAFYLSESNIIHPESRYDILISGGKNAWNDLIQEGKTKRLYLYVFEVDTLKKYNNGSSMLDLVKAKRFTKVISYSERDLVDLGWNVEVAF